MALKGILALMPKDKGGDMPPGPDASDGSSDSGDDPKKMAAQDLIDALGVKGADAGAVADAMQRLYDSCDKGDKSGPEADMGD